MRPVRKGKRKKPMNAKTITKKRIKGEEKGDAEAILSVLKKKKIAP